MLFAEDIPWRASSHHIIDDSNPLMIHYYLSSPTSQYFLFIFLISLWECYLSRHKLNNIFLACFCYCRRSSGRAISAAKNRCGCLSCYIWLKMAGDERRGIVHFFTVGITIQQYHRWKSLLSHM